MTHGTPATGLASAAPRASIIVPVYNGSRLIRRCLDALSLQTLALDAWELIVVDDGSTDDTAAIIEQWLAEHPACDAQLLRQSHAGPGVARNTGAQAARAPLLLFTDADCAPEPDWADRLIAVFDDPAVVGAKGVYLSRQTGLVPRFVQAEYDDRHDRVAVTRQVDAVDTYSAGYRRAIFLENGGFDPTFVRACEDQEFSFRLAEQGHLMVFAPDVKVWHLHAETIWGYMRRKYHTGFWKARLTRLHPDRMVYDSHTPQALKAQIVLSAAMVASVPLGFVGFRFPVLQVAWWGFGGAALLFYLSAGPFLVKLWQRSPALAGMGLILLQARALALGAGYLLGTIHFNALEAQAQQDQAQQAQGFAPAQGWRRTLARIGAIFGAIGGLLLSIPLVAMRIVLRLLPGVRRGHPEEEPKGISDRMAG